MIRSLMSFVVARAKATLWENRSRKGKSLVIVGGVIMAALVITVCAVITYIVAVTGWLETMLGLAIARLDLVLLALILWRVWGGRVRSRNIDADAFTRAVVTVMVPAIADAVKQAMPVTGTIPALKPGECPQCHRQNEADAKFCQGCGGLLGGVAVETKTKVEAGQGESCPRCGTLNVGRQYCSKCNARLSPAQQESRRRGR